MRYRPPRLMTVGKVSHVKRPLALAISEKIILLMSSSQTTNVNINVKSYLSNLLTPLIMFHLIF